jgi:hypothetical protein
MDVNLNGIVSMEIHKSGSFRLRYDCDLYCNELIYYADFILANVIQIVFRNFTAFYLL